MVDPLHVILAPTGSAGDVHPFIGIGKLLHQRGHDVTVITNGRFAAASQKAGLRFVEHGTDEQFEQVIADADLWHPLRGLRVVMTMVARLMQDQYRLIGKVYEPDRSVVVGHTLSWGARVFEDKHHAPGATMHIAPMCFRTVHELPAPGDKVAWLPIWIKRAAWWLADKLFVDRFIVPELNRWRAELELPAVNRPLKQWLHSPNRVVALFPDWFARPQPDWPAQTRLTGFPLFDEAGQHDADPQLEAFLAAGDAPVAFTPGSAMRHGQAFFNAAIDAAQRLGRRALLLTRYRHTLPDALPDHVLHVPYAPFSEVLPRCAAFVHHGGIGSSAQGLAAGVPQLIMPMGFDQPDNAARLRRLGAGDWVGPRRFTGKRVAAKLSALLSSADVAEACAKCRQMIAASDANERTCDLIEQVGFDAMGSTRRRPAPSVASATA